MLFVYLSAKSVDGEDNLPDILLLIQIHRLEKVGFVQAVLLHSLEELADVFHLLEGEFGCAEFDCIAPCQSVDESGKKRWRIYYF